MSYKIRKILVICAAAIAPFLFSHKTFAAAPQQETKNLQPQALNYTGIYQLQNLDPNLMGSSVKFGIICRSNSYMDGQPQNDYRPDISHNCFASNKITFYDQGVPPAETSSHSTAACSILFGSDTNAYNEQSGDFIYRGAAPKSQADIFEFWYFLSNNIFPQVPPNDDIITASFGSPFDEWWTRGFEAMAENFGITIVASIGNGSDAYDSALYPAAGSNVIGVGVIDSVESAEPSVNLTHFALAWPEHSSCGPTGDKRAKPDIVAPGNCLAANEETHESYEPTGNWSSFSTSVVTGAAGLLIQKAKQTPSLNQAVSPQGGNCVIKALLLNSAKKLAYWHKGQLSKDDDHIAPLDLAQGAGLLDAMTAYKILIAGPAKAGKVNNVGWDNNLLDKNSSSQNYNFNLSDPNGKLIVATLAWNKHFDSSYPFEALPEKNSDLRLELWGVDKTTKEHLLDYSDSLMDNLEHIYIPADPNFTNYKITVALSPNNVNQIGERFALAWNIAEKQDTNILWYDLNSDGTVNQADFEILTDNMLNSIKFQQGYYFGDINSDGKIDDTDVQNFLKNLNTKAGWLN